MNTDLTASKRFVERHKDLLVDDLKRVLADADRLLKEVGHSSAEEFAAAKRSIEARLDSATSQLADAGSAVSERARRAASATGQYVCENPWKSFAVAVAVAAAVVFGVTSKRR